ncbi:MAG TPA: trigger factor [Candidatus Limnocylindrales bacterium]|nr:trigger factor [Candidatus Limnocylindrales bacterium]
MKVTATPAPRSTVHLEVEVPPEQVSRAVDLALRHLGQRTRVPGFRPGKVPRPMLERALGVRRDDPAAPNPIHDEAKDHLFEQTVGQALVEADVAALDIPQPEWLHFGEGTDGAAYALALPVSPKVELGDYTAYPFAPELEPTDAASVDKVIEELRDQHATLVPVEDRAAADDDYAVISYEATRDGQPFEGGSAERFPLILGKERMIPGFEAQLVGLREGEEKTFELTFPDDYPDSSLAGQKASFHVTLRELRAKVLPEADDEFARSVGDFADLAAMRADVQRRLEANARDRARHLFADRIIEYAVANATVDPPDLLVDREVEVMHDELRLRLAEQGIGYDEYLKVTEKDDAALHAQFRPDAEHRVKVLLVLETIADKEGLVVPEELVEAEVARDRERTGRDRKLADYFASERGRRYVRTTLRRSRIVEELVDRWLAAHPEVGPLPHLEDASATPEADAQTEPTAEAGSTTEPTAQAPIEEEAPA